MSMKIFSRPAVVRIAVILGLWCLVTLSFALLRSSAGFITDDSIRLYQNMHLNPNPERWTGWGTVKYAFVYSFATYPLRQLTGVLTHLTMSVCWDPDHVPFIVCLFAGSLVASLALSLFFVAKRFVRSDIWAVFAVFLTLFSTPFITGAWMVCTGIQTFVPLMICLGLLSYWRALEAKRHRWIYYVCLFLIMFFGHWFREFVGLLPLLVIFLEIQRARRPTWLMAVCLLCFLHAVFPSVLPRFWYPGLPLLPVYKLSGPLGRVMGAGGSSFIEMIKAVLQSLNVSLVVCNFLSLLPPVLWIMAFVSLALRVAFLWSGRLPRSVCSSGLWLFLVFWFLLFFLPFLKVYAIQVHFAYTLVPMSVIMAVLMRDLWGILRSWKFSSLRWAFAALLALVTGDHALNLYGSCKVVRGMNDGIKHVAEWFKSNAPPKSIVISNAGHTVDIIYYSLFYFDVYWVQPIPFPYADSGKTADMGVMEKMILDEAGKRRIYFLDINYDFIPGKEHYHGHKYIRGRKFPVKKLGRVWTTRVYYPFLDPLKHFIPRAYISFMSAPDLENDFYTGPAQDGSLFLREFHANYDVYDALGVFGRTKITASSLLQPELGPGCLLENRDPTWHAAAPVVFPQTLTFEFPSARTVRSVSFHPQGEPSWPEPHNSAMIGRSPKRVGVETSADGVTWRELCVIDPACSALRWNSHTLPEPVTTKFIRLKIYSSCRDGLTLKGVKFED
jgi:hypothetical protein